VLAPAPLIAGKLVIRGSDQGTVDVAKITSWF